MLGCVPGRLILVEICEWSLRLLRLRCGWGKLGLLSAVHVVVVAVWGFPKIRGTLFWGPHNKDPTI